MQPKTASGPPPDPAGNESQTRPLARSGLRRSQTLSVVGLQARATFGILLELGLSFTRNVYPIFTLALGIGMDLAQPPYGVTPLEEALAHSIAPRRFNLLLLALV